MSVRALSVSSRALVLLLAVVLAACGSSTATHSTIGGSERRTGDGRTDGGSVGRPSARTVRGPVCRGRPRPPRRLPPRPRRPLRARHRGCSERAPAVAAPPSRAAPTRSRTRRRVARGPSARSGKGSGTQFMQYYFLYDQLAKLSVDTTEWLPSLADSWTLAPDGLSAEFKLHPGVTWHDGQPFTADDVAYTYRAQLMVTDAYIDDPLLVLLKGGKAFRDGTSEDLGVTAVDPMTVRFDFDAPSPLWMDILMQRPILPKHVWEPIVTRTTTLADIGNVEPTTQGIGTGPFKVGSYDSETSAEYLKNAAYFAGEPNIDSIIFRFVVEETTIAAGVEAGEIDGAAIWDSTTYPRLEQVPTLHADHRGSGDGLVRDPAELPEDRHPAAGRQVPPGDVLRDPAPGDRRPVSSRASRSPSARSSTTRRTSRG